MRFESTVARVVNTFGIVASHTCRWSTGFSLPRRREQQAKACTPAIRAKNRLCADQLFIEHTLIDCGPFRATFVVVGELHIVQPHQAQDRCMDVLDMHLVIDGVDIAGASSAVPPHAPQ